MRIIKLIIGTIAILLALKEETETIKLHNEGKHEDSIFAGQIATMFFVMGIGLMN